MFDSSRVETRSQWVDVAKAVAIVCVVFFHAGSLTFGNDTAARYWHLFGVGLFTFIMPLFFLVSGLFVGKSLELPFGRYLLVKVWPLLYLWIMWSALFAILDYLTGGRIGATIVQSATMQTILWFLPALAIHMTVARLLRNVSSVVQLVGAAVLAVPFALFFPFDGWGLAHTPHFLVFFLVGVLWRHSVMSAVQSVRAKHVGGLLAVAALLASLVVAVPSSARAVYALAPLVAVPAVLVLAALLSRWKSMARPLSALGRNTLPIFLTHPIVLQVFGTVLTGRQLGVAFGLAMPVFATVASVGVGLTAWIVLHRVSGVFAPPRALTGDRKTWLKR